MGCIVFFTFSCHKDALKTAVTEENVQEIADKYGVRMTFTPNPDSLLTTGATGKYTLEDMEAEIKQVAKMNKWIKELNEKNASRYASFMRDLGGCTSLRDTLATFLRYPDVAQLDQGSIEQCIELGLLKKYDNKN